MGGIDIFDADGRGRARDARGHYGEYCARDRGEVVGIDVGEPPFPHPPNASISSPSGIGVEGDMKIVEGVSLEFLPQTDAVRLVAGGRRDIDDNNNERLEVEEAPREMEVAGMESKAAGGDGEDGIYGVMGGHLHCQLRWYLQWRP